MGLRESASEGEGVRRLYVALKVLVLDGVALRALQMGCMAIYGLILDSCSDGVHWTEGSGGDEMDNDGEIGQNHWSWWAEDNSGGCIMPRISEERAEARRAWLAKHFPDYTWKECVDAFDLDDEALGVRLLEALRKYSDDRL